MSSTFSHSLRSMQVDNNRVSRLALFLFSVIFLGWLLWFFFATVTLYESGEIGQTSSDGVVIAHFSNVAQSKLQLGQAVQLRLAGATPTTAIPATVADIVQNPITHQIDVTLYADMDSPNVSALQNGGTGKVNVAVEQVSPARLVLRAAGLGG